MEELIASVVLGGLAVSITGWWFLKHRAAARDLHIDEVPEELQAMVPASLHPVIDPAICIGSAACVAACPEQKTLALHRGRALLVHPNECIGHGECAAECPVGAIKLVFGSSERGVDIPHVTSNFETNVPGLFVVGELGGMGLIRNAVVQGVEAIEHIASLDRSKVPAVHDVLVVGAGPAGMAATLAARSKGLRVVTVDQDSPGGTINHYPRKKVVMLAPMDIPIYGRVKARQMPKEELVGIWDEALQRAEVDIVTGARVTDVQREDGHFRVETSAGTHHAKRVVLAIGRRGTPRKLGVPGEELPKVAYSLKEPEVFEGMRVLVVGGGDSAIEAAVTLAELPGTTVHLSFRRDVFDRARTKNIEAIKGAAEAGQLEILYRSSVREIRPDEVVLDWDGKEHVLPNDQVLVFAGGVLPTELLQRMGISMERKFGTA